MKKSFAYKCLGLIILVGIVFPPASWGKDKDSKAQQNPFQRILSRLQSQTVSDEAKQKSLDKPPVRNPFTPTIPEPVEIPASQNDKPKPKPPEPIKPQPWVPPSPTDRTTKSEKTSMPALKIQGIVWNTQRPQAIINDQVIDVGDVIDGSTIKEITRTGVVVERSGKEFTILYNLK